jgi:serine/threonine protein kinase
MRLVPSTRLGPYEIQDALGAGGMGEVYRAIDSRLRRTVAIKVLPEHLSTRPEARERLEREARAISSLNHPHICTLYDIGHQDGMFYLVMEYLQGETMTKRLGKRPLPLDQVLRYATEIAGALDQAHRHGVIHRDLKPGNMMLTKSGIKLLDFGLAKLHETASGAVAGTMASNTESLTGEGTIAGTLQYMAPEQLEGKQADARTDIFAFGAVVYEMATGRKAFEGNSTASLMAAILEHDPPPVSTLQRMTPPTLDLVIKTCLAKDPDDRWQTARDLLHGIQAAAITPAPALGSRRRSAKLWIWGAIGILWVASLAIVQFRHPPPQAPAMRFLLPPPEDQAFALVSFNGPNAFSPDGRRIAFVTLGNRLWVRALDSLTAHVLPGAAGFNPFWSPDGLSVGFNSTGGKLSKISVAGGPPQVLADAPMGQGGTWNRDGTILFVPNLFGPLYRISAQGGTPSQVTTLDASRHEVAHLWPYFLPDGKHFLYTAMSYQRRESEIYVGSLDSVERKRLVTARSNAAYAPGPNGRTGRVLYARESTLMAQEFDPNRLVLAGEPAAVTENVEYFGDLNVANFSVSHTGALIFRGASVSPTVQLTWFDRTGRRMGSVGGPSRYLTTRLSPDERSVAVTQELSQAGSSDIWILDLARGSASPFTFGPVSASAPVWSPDGRRIVFSSSGDGFGNLYQKATDGSAGEEASVKSNAYKMAFDWSRDGRFILFGSLMATGDLWILPLFGDRHPFPLIETEFNEWMGRFSPDGKVIAYQSDESGSNQIYVRSLPNMAEKPLGSGRWQVSNGGGIEPTWRRDGKELFYIAGDGKLMSIEVKSTVPLAVGQPRPLFDTHITGWSAGSDDYSVTADGKRFLVSVKTADAVSPPITVVLNWAAGLKQK